MNATQTAAVADALNRDCDCASLDTAALARELDAQTGSAGFAALVAERWPHAFAAEPVFVAPKALERIADVVRAVEPAVATPAWQQRALAQAPAAARVASGARGVFDGYDFHVAGERVALIEINTNAGGAMLAATLARAQRACCAPMHALLPTPGRVAAFEQAIVDMFVAEWRRAGRSGRPATIAIVDDAPQAQFLYPEFVLFERLFERHGLGAVIADAAELEWRDGRLWHAGRAIDVVYDRLTDFYLAEPAHAALHAAHAAGAVVLTPHPRAHALYADKRRLAWLGDEPWLREIGVPEEARRVLAAHVPPTELVDARNADALWARRRELFFKPAAGYGSRAAYRGDKLTRGTWRDIVEAGEYVAQRLVVPGERRVADPAGGADARRALKFDVRAWAYDGAVQWVAARLYQGQTTNMRTPGGGFAPVCATGDAEAAA
jgi:hypothetical protein